VHAPGLAALERGKERVDLVRERGDDREVERGVLVEVVGDRDVGALAVRQNDPAVALQLGEAPGTGAGHGGDVVAGARELVGEGAADAPDADDRDRQGGGGCGAHDGSFWVDGVPW
jgi:hypothetical protein